MSVKGSINKAISKLLVLVVLLITVIYSLLILVYSWLIEDNIFNRQVLNEASYIKQVYQSSGKVVSPRIAYMSLHRNWEGLPIAFKTQHEIKPDQVEFDAGNEGTVHIHIFELDNVVYALASNVSAFEVSRDYLPRVLIWLGIFSIICCSLVASVTYFSARKITKPLEALADEVSTKSDSDKVRIEGQYPNNEIGVLASCLKDTFEKFYLALSRETHFTKDVSHEIRTPVAIAKNILEKPLAEVSALEWQKLNETNFRVEQVTETLLALARNESTEKQLTNITATLEQCILNNADIKYTPKGQNIEFEILEQQDVYKEVNPNLISILLNNILSNIIHYSSANTVTINVAKSGIEFRNYYRQPLPESPLESGNKGLQSQGIGHGLNLIKRIAEIYNWQITLDTDKQVFRLTIVF